MLRAHGDSRLSIRSYAYGVWTPRELTRGCAPGPPARLQRVDKCYHQQRRRI